MLAKAASIVGAVFAFYNAGRQWTEISQTGCLKVKSTVILCDWNKYAVPAFEIWFGVMFLWMTFCDSSDQKDTDQQ